MLFVYVGTLRLSVMVTRCLYWSHRVYMGGCLSRQLTQVSWSEEDARIQLLVIRTLQIAVCGS